MMRDSGSVKLYWSPSRGPGTGGVGGRPPGRRPVVRSRSARCASLASYSACSAAARSAARASSTTLASASRARRSSRRAISAPTTSPSGTSGWSLCSRKREQLLDLASQLGFHPQQPLVTDRVVLGGISMDLGPVQTDRPQLQHTRLLGEQEYLDEEVLQLGQEGAPKRGQRIMVGMQVARDEAERHRLIRGALDLTRTEHPGGIAIEQQAQQDLGGVRFPTAGPIVGIQRREVKLSHAVHYEARQMVGGQTVAQAHRQIQCLVVVHGFECSFHAHQYTITDGECLFLSDKLLARRESSMQRVNKKE